jgi:hypothetical protein
VRTQPRVRRGMTETSAAPPAACSGESPHGAKVRYKAGCVRPVNRSCGHRAAFGREGLAPAVADQGRRPERPLGSEPRRRPSRRSGSGSENSNTPDLLPPPGVHLGADIIASAPRGKHDAASAQDRASESRFPAALVFRARGSPCATVRDSRPPIGSGSERSASGLSASASSESAH